ncbi:hypothetical protein IHQ72_10990 [Mesorhizobium onobrychidis]|uniref:Helix-turn-helix domain-containing protein n=2 Tax=Mesorhizobium onobrychidis TaxID=2775404 RepID=A0ABY5R2P6_9HYPH|nr:hypothetical protein IHQ72_10990 [Mesorhizobium onobrychidis]
MRLSPAWKALRGNDKLLLERLEEEHMAHAGTTDVLPVTFSDFEEWGVRRAAIAECIARVEALGFVECIERGRASKAEHRFPTKYRLTYAHGPKVRVTDEWAKVVDQEDAQRRIDAAIAGLQARSSALSIKLKRSAELRAEQRALQGRKAA